MVNSHLPPIMKTIQVRRTRHAGHCWRSRDKLISDVLLWTPSYGWAKAGRPAWTYIQQLCEDTGCSPEDLPEAMNDREKWRERVRDICATSTKWWWWWWSWSNIIKSDPKTLFSITSTWRYKRGHYSFPWIAPLPFDLDSIMLSVKQVILKKSKNSTWCQVILFEYLVWFDLELNPGLLDQ